MTDLGIAVLGFFVGWGLRELWERYQQKKREENRRLGLLPGGLVRGRKYA